MPGATFHVELDALSGFFLLPTLLLVPIRHIDPGIKSHPSRATGADFQTGAS